LGGESTQIGLFKKRIELDDNMG